MALRPEDVPQRLVSGPLKLFIPVALAPGIMIAAGQSPFSVPWLTLLGWFFAAALIQAAQRPGRAAALGWLLGIGYFAVSLLWIVEPFFIHPQRHGWMAPFALFFMAAGLSLFWAIGFWAAFKLTDHRALRLIALIATFGLVEFARSYLFTGFPWGLQGYIWVDTPFMQLAAYLGPHGVGALTLFMAFAPHMSARMALGLLATVIILGVGLFTGFHRLDLPDLARDHPVSLRLIQPNAPQKQKWDPKLSDMFFERQLDLTKSPSQVSPDVVIWPETAIAYWLDEKQEAQKRIVSALPETSRVILGARRYDQRVYFNSLAVLGKDGLSEIVYDKVRLVPFGEYVPFGTYLSRLGIKGLASEEGGGFTSGQQSELINLGKAGSVLPLICYEAIFPQFVNVTPRPDWLLQITNDAWYGEFSGPQQHFAQARVRAIEQGLPFVRVANTGISAVIDSRGRVLAQLPLGASGALDAPLPGRMAATFYSRTGDWAVFFLFLILVVAVRIRASENRD